MGEEWTDHSAETLPPLWVTTEPVGNRGAERVGRLFQSGGNRELRDAILRVIDDAKQVVCLCSFLLSDANIYLALLAAASRGVRVYVLTASREQLERLPEDEERSRDRIESHQKRLDELAGKVLVRCSNRYHAKFVLADPETDDARGLLSTANFNPALVRNAELGLTLTPDDVRAAFSFFCKAFWSHAGNELRRPGELGTCQGRPFPMPELHSRVVWTLPESRCLGERVMALLESATSSITVAVYGLDTRHRAFGALIDRASAGVPVTVLLPLRAKLGQAAIELANAGAKVVGVERLHAKAVVADDEAVLMTANLERHGLDQGCELGVVLDEDETLELMVVLESWEKSASWRLRAGVRVGEVLGAVMEPNTGKQGEVLEESEGPCGKLRWAHRTRAPVPQGPG